MPRTLLRRTPPNPLSLRLLLSLVKSQPASLAAGTGALFNLLFTIPYCRGAPNTSTAMRPLDCLHRTIRSSISFRFRLYFQIVWSTVRMVLLFSFFFSYFSVMVYGLRCSILPLDRDGEGISSDFFFDVTSFQDTPSAFERQFSFVCLLVTVPAHTYRQDNEFHHHISTHNLVPP